MTLHQHKLIGDEKASPEALQQMRERSAEGAHWAAYQNVALDSDLLGALQFLKVGPGCTYAEPPEKFPADTMAGMGWRYLFVGWVNLGTGEIEETP